MQCSLKPESRFLYTFPFIPAMPSRLFTPVNPYLDSILYQQMMDHDKKAGNQNDATLYSHKVFDTPYHAATLFEPRFDLVKASKWTNITSSNELVRTLLALYFQHDYPYATFFHKDHFLDDMVAGQERYCSPLLVNAILAAACVRPHYPRSERCCTPVYN
jgi:hypothetical protein